jgi:hypothetical protein
MAGFELDEYITRSLCQAFSWIFAAMSARLSDDKEISSVCQKTDFVLRDRYLVSTRPGLYQKIHMVRPHLNSNSDLRGLCTE